MAARRPADTEHVPGGQEARKATLRGGALFGDFLWRRGQRKLLARKRETLLSSHPRRRMRSVLAHDVIKHNAHTNHHGRPHGASYTTARKSLSSHGDDARAACLLMI